MSQRSDKLAKEELRAILVLGIIGTLFTAAQLSPRYVLPPSYMGFTLKWVTYVLLFYWGTYLFFAVIGISDDWVADVVTHACDSFARFLFLGGIGILSGMVFLVLIGSAESYFGFRLSVLNTIQLSSVPAVLIAILIGLPKRLYHSKSQGADQQPRQRKNKRQSP